MKLAICNSKYWFHLDQSISQKCEVLSIKSKSELTLKKLEDFAPDIVFFPHWNWIVQKEIFSRFTCIVFHAAPLPYGRGGSPIQNLIIRGHKSTPVCAIKMSDGIDNGPIYDQELISLEGKLSEIFNRLDFAVNKLIERLIVNIPKPEPQFGEVYTFKRLSHEDNEIRADTTIEQIYDQIRMLDDDNYPSAYIRLKNVLIEFYEITKVSSELECKVRISKKEKMND